MGEEPGRSVPDGHLREAWAAAEPAGRQADAPAPGVPGPGRIAANAGGAARLPRRHVAERLREGGGPAARQPGLWRTLGPALDGRLALFRLVRPAGGAGPVEQRPANLALARLDRAVA